jgi:hypothetical protein
MQEILTDHFLFNRRLLLRTETELNAIAMLEIIGERSIPKNGYKTPAATGMPIIL